MQSRSCSDGIGERFRLSVVNPGCSFSAWVIVLASMFQPSWARSDTLQGKLMSSIKVPYFPTMFPTPSFIGYVWLSSGQELVTERLERNEQGAYLSVHASVQGI